MDPNANLTVQLELAKRIAKGTTDERAEMLADLVLALDGWIRSGGFLPTEWKQEPF